MLCKIADLYAEIPEAGGMSSRLGEYAVKELDSANIIPDITIREEKYVRERWPGIRDMDFAYMESGSLFYVRLVKLGGMMLHSSAVELDGKAYLFSGPSGMGKSTHSQLWKQCFPNAKIFNDDKPALREIDGVWYAYGTPWCGKDGININMKAPVQGICFLKRGSENQIRRLSKLEAASAILSQTIRNFAHPEQVEVLLKVIERLIDKAPVYELKCKPEPEAALLSYKTMSANQL